MYYVQKSTNESIPVNISKANIAWTSDQKFKFISPSTPCKYYDISVNLKACFFILFYFFLIQKALNTIKPPNWASNLSVYTTKYYENQDLIVWMRTSAFPTFRKLYGRILVEENSKLADKVSDGNKTSRLNILRNELLSKYWNDTSFLGMEPMKKTVHKYRLPRGQYYVEIDYSNYEFYF